MSAMIPRLYQQEALKAAAERNIICRMDTGTGKTLIGIMLIRHITSLPTTSTKHSLVVFIVPTVSLVDQTTKVLQSQTALRVTPFVGSQGVDYWKREQWTEQLEQADVIVLTAQIWLNALGNGYWEMEKVSLIVFDECHHATKNHPYCRIMKDHYHTKPPGSQLPRILGLTASPVWNPKNPAKSIADLEANLDARIFEVSAQHSATLLAAAPKPAERLIEFDPSVASAPTATELRFLEVYGSQIEPKTAERLNATRLRLGPLGLSLHILQLAKDFGATQDLLEELVELSHVPIDASTVSPQVRALLLLLDGYQDQVDKTFHSIIFVQQRAHAQILCEIVKRVGSLKGWLRAGFLVGHGGRGGPEAEKDLGMEVKHQQRVLESFRSGELNLIFATQVAEEGLDIRACNVVVRFDGLQTITAYIQSRGRARSAASDYIVMAERDSREASVYRDYLEKEQELRDIYSARPAEDDIDEPELDGTPTFTVPTTGALLTYQSAIPLLSQVCSLLRKDDFSTQQKPEFMVEGSAISWSCSLRMPSIAALGGVRSFRSVGLPSKKGARQAVAFAVCLELYDKGVIDDWLLPVRETRREGARDADGKEVDCAEVPQLGVPTRFQSAFGNLWADDDQPVHINIVQVAKDGQQHQFALVCATDLAREFDLGALYEDGSTIDVKIISSSAIIWSSPDDRATRLSQLQVFNSDVSRTAIFRKIVDEQPFVALWAPLVSQHSTDIDWFLVEFPSTPAVAATLREGDVIVIPSRRPTVRLGKLIKVRGDVDSLSETSTIESAVTAASSRRKMVQRYPTYHIYCKVAYDYHDVSEVDAEAIIDIVSIVAVPRNLLVPTSETTAPPRKSRSYPISMCATTRLDEAFWTLVVSIPSLNRLINDVVQVRRAKAHFSFPEIDPHKLRQALTPPFLRRRVSGLTTNISRLVATTVHTFLSHSMIDEGRLSVIRQNSVDNRFLRSRSIKSGYSSFILAERFKTNTWTPVDEEARQLGIEGERLVGRRALADTIEATLGAAYSTGGLVMALETGDRLGLCFGGAKPWAERSAARELSSRPSIVPPALQELQSNLGHTFRDGSLLLQAVTHRSYTAATTYCYERLEYLGDALLDLWATDLIFRLFPSSTPRHLTFLRSLLVSNPTLAFLASRLQIHRTVLHSSPLLEIAMLDTVTQAAAYDWSAVVSGDLTWLWDPPKVLGDCLEASLAAIFVDAGCRIEAVYRVLDALYAGVLPLLSQVESRDPYSRLLMFIDGLHCRGMTIKNTRDEATSTYTATCTFHSQLIATHSNKTKAVARQLTARLALAFLCSDSAESTAVLGLCCCEKEARELKALARVANSSVSDVLAEGGDVEVSEDGPKRALESGSDSDEASPSQRVRVY